MSHIFASLIFLSLFWLANHDECSGHRRTSRDAFPALKTDTRFQRSSTVEEIAIALEVPMYQLRRRTTVRFVQPLRAVPEQRRESVPAGTSRKELRR
jgi:hypothetical protein